MANTYSLRIVATAWRELKQLPRPIQNRIRRAIRHLALDPRRPGAKPLAGTRPERIWRMRVADYRILYEIHDDRLVVLVIRVAHRREAYRNER
ncbi:MAG: type II toxin-antitoxin system RelE/ParE family toxin [Chloroflexota bacterium]